jgi:flagellar biosynthesis/type III secretory pathway M-ring protein FliF/YscJ
MDRFKQQFDQLKQQLATLTPSQRMLAGTLVAIVGVTVFWYAQNAGKSDMQELLNQPLTPQQTGQITDLLGRHGIDVRNTNGTLLVPAARREEAIALLSWERALPEDTTRHFDDALGNIGSFDPAKKINLTILAARQRELSSTIRKWPGIRDARVSVNETHKRQIGRGGDVLPTASVDIATAGGADARVVAETAARYVSGAFSQLEPKNVQVVVDGKSIDIGAGDALAAGGDKLLELQARAETYWEGKLHDQFAHIPGLRATVRVSVENDVRRTFSEQLDPDSKVVLPIETTEETDDRQQADAGGWGEAGFRPNVALSASATAAAAPSDSRASRTATERNHVEVGRTREESYREGGATRAVGCTVALPLSWVRDDWQQRNGGDSAEGPSPEVLRAYEISTRQSLATSVRALLGIEDDSSVVVMTYADAGDGEVGPVAALAADVTDSGMIALAREHGSAAVAVVLGGLALLIVGNLARGSTPITTGTRGSSRSTPVTAADLAMLAAQAGPRSAGSEQIDDALAAETTMIAQEVADEQLQAGQMVEQVQSLVKENPDAAAKLVRRWLSSS